MICLQHLWISKRCLIMYGVVFWDLLRIPGIPSCVLSLLTGLCSERDRAMKCGPWVVFGGIQLLPCLWPITFQQVYDLSSGQKEGGRWDVPLVYAPFDWLVVSNYMKAMCTCIVKEQWYERQKDRILIVAPDVTNYFSRSSLQHMWVKCVCFIA